MFSLDFYPSVYEVQSATNIFTSALQQYGQNMAAQTAIRCSVAKVWQQARQYQNKREIAQEEVNTLDQLQIFESKEFGKMRSALIEGEPWFVGKDIASALGYKNTKDALSRHVDFEDKRDGVAFYDPMGREQNPVIINESGLYSLILSSKLPSAKRFKHWVTSEVLPAIHRNGGYINGQETMSDAELMAKALMVAQNTIASKNKELERIRPKAIFADAVAASHNAILVGDLAKILKQNGVDIGSKRFFEWLRENGYLIRRKGSDRNMPTQRSMEMGLFEIKETTVSHADGHTTINKTPKVTGKGQQYFINLFLLDRKKEQ